MRDTWRKWGHNRHLNDGHHLENHKGNVRMPQKGVQGASQREGDKGQGQRNCLEPIELQSNLPYLLFPRTKMSFLHFTSSIGESGPWVA